MSNNHDVTTFNHDVFNVAVFEVVTTRTVTVDECPWLTDPVDTGTVLETRSDIFNIVSASGVAVGFAGEELYFELPASAVQPRA